MFGFLISLRASSYVIPFSLASADAFSKTSIIYETGVWSGSLKFKVKSIGISVPGTSSEVSFTFTIKFSPLAFIIMPKA